MVLKIQQEYDTDFYAWALHNADLLRRGRLSEIDVQHVAEELESMGKGDKRELINRLALLMAHLLKWQYQPLRRSRSWKLTIKEQRIKIINLLEESPSLNNEIKLKLDDAYEQAIVIASRQTAIDESVFPERCPFSLEQCLNHDFFPDV